MKVFSIVFVIGIGIISAVGVFFPAAFAPAVPVVQAASSERHDPASPFLFRLPEKKYLLSSKPSVSIPTNRSESAFVPLVLFTEVTQVLREKCMPCHTWNYTVPLYGKIPGLGSLVERDYKEGLRHVNFAAELSPGGQGKAVNEVFLAKVERTLADKRMPPPQYISAYLSAQLNASERDLLQTWVHQTRLTCYATGLASPEFATEPVQPLPDAVPVDNRKVDLGARLFFDTRLSGNNAMTCASCHFLNHSGADGKEAPSGITGEVVELNAPTVFNAVFHLRQFWNGRARDLQEQALDPPVDPREMGSGNWTEICNRLAQSASLQQEFMELYADGITAQNVGNALAEFEKTLITPNCRFDRYLKGDKNAISVIEKDGYALFKASRCATCHVGKALGGQSVEYLNLKADFYADRQVVPRPADMGVYTFTGREEDKFKFKVPSLRNTAETGPWYHDGKIKTLNEAVSLMGVYQCGITLEENAVELIVAFLHTLTGEYMGRAVRK